METEMYPQEIEEEIERIYPKVKDLVALTGMTKDQWIEEAIRGPQRLFVRCENCRDWPCESIENLKEDYPLIIKIWYEHGNACRLFEPKAGAE